MKQAENLSTKKSDVSLFFTQIWRRVNKHNQNYMALVCGPTGSGKSYAALRLCELLDPKFSLEKVIFSSDEFLDLLNERDLEKGEFVVWDEAGAGLASRQWMTQENIAMGKIAQTFRHRNLGVIFTVPSAEFVDIQIRKLVHSLFVTQHIDRWRKVCVCRHYIIQNNPLSGKVYKKREEVFDKSDNIRRIEFIEFNLPSKKLRDGYEEKKKVFTAELNRGTNVSHSPKMMAKDILENHRDKIRKWGGRKTIPASVVRQLYNPKRRDVDVVKRWVEAGLNG